MNTRLAFPACVIAMAAVESCQGITQNDAAVKRCRVDTVMYQAPSDSSTTIRVIPKVDSTKCRKAA